MTDYIIVGGGSAGCVAASRLSEDRDASVLLLVQGGRDFNLYLHVPAAYSKLYKSDKLKHYQLDGSGNAASSLAPMVQANILGGGSSVNGLVYIRGCPEDYDGWNEMGCSGWSYQEVLPYFRRAEDNESLGGAAHGTGGPIGVSDQRYTHPLTKAWLRACHEAGIAPNADFNSGTQAGCGLYQLTTRHGHRSSAVAYLRARRRRRGLKVMSGVRVLRIIVERDRAVGVEYVRHGKVAIARADREVVLCAGAIGSPHLLLRSGIGPADHLRAQGIPVAHDLPGVGHNLHDHAIIYMLYDLHGGDSFDKYRNPAWQAWAALEYGLFRSGPATSNVIEGGAFWYGKDAGSLPDLQAFFFPGSAVEDGMEGVPSGRGCGLAVSQSRPRSRGTIMLRSSDPLAPPVIRPNYLSDPEDVRCLAEGVRIGQEVMSQPAMVRHIGQDSLSAQRLRSQADREGFVRQKAQGAYHPCGACKMGTDELSVVDPSLRVHGLRGLRVADTSIIPSIPSGNLNAPAIMIGERVADFVRQSA